MIAQQVKNPPAMQETGLIPESGRSPRELVRVHEQQLLKPVSPTACALQREALFSCNERVAPAHGN